MDTRRAQRPSTAAEALRAPGFRAQAGPERFTVRRAPAGPHASPARDARVRHEQPRRGNRRSGHTVVPGDTSSMLAAPDADDGAEDSISSAVAARH